MPYCRLLVCEPLPSLIAQALIVRPVRSIFKCLVQSFEPLVVTLPRAICLRSTSRERIVSPGGHRRFSTMLLFLVRRNETICCLIGFGIGVGCCILYRLISHLFTPRAIVKKASSSSIVAQCDVSVPATFFALISFVRSYQVKNVPASHESKIPCSKRTKYDHDDDDGVYVRNNHMTDEMTWSEMSSSLSNMNLLHDSYHSNSLTADSGVDCSDMPVRCFPTYSTSIDEDEDNETLLRKYDSDTALHHDSRK